jgi:predicted permease
MQTFLQDLRYALRQLRNAPGFAATAVVTLALGIGVTATVASLVRQVLLAPLPYPEPKQLVGIAFSWPEATPNAEQTGATADFLARNTTSFASLTTLDDNSSIANLSEDGHAISIHVLGVSRSYFETLGVAPLIGRAFTTDEDRAGGPTALVLSYGLWQRAFAGDRAILGRSLRLNQESITVVGVMPAGFRFEAYSSRNTLGNVDAFRPIQLSPKTAGYEGDNFEMFARLKSGVTIQQALQELSALEPALYSENPYLKLWKNSAGRTPVLRAWPMVEVVAGDVHDSLIVMTWATVAVLLLTCLNLAGLNTARAMRRSAEFSLRSALGASPARMLRLAMLETSLLTLAGIAAAVAVVQILLPFLLKASPIPIPTLNGDASVWATTAQAFVIGAASASLFGWPLAAVALRSSRKGMGQTAMVRSNRSGSLRSSHSKAGRILIVMQIGLAVLLVSTASTLLGTFLKLRAQPTGFQPERLIVFQTNLKGDRYATTQATTQFVNKVLTSLQQSRGVRDAAAINGLPMDRGLNISGWPGSRSNLKRNVEFRTITPGYFHTMGLPLLQGRDFNDADGPRTQPVTVISESAARKWWPDRSPLGDVVHTGTNPPMLIIGVAVDAPGNSLADQPPVLFYGPMAQQADEETKMLNGWFSTSFAIRVAGPMEVELIVRQAVSAADPEIPVANFATMRQMIDTSVAAPRFFTQLAEGFAAFGVLLTAIGLFGLLSYQVVQRTREIGIRMALGASRGMVLRSVLAASGRLTLIGGAIGATSALLLRPLLSRWIAESVVGVDAADQRLLFNGEAAVFASLAALLCVALFASLLPARRAASVEPMEALRAE